MSYFNANFLHWANNYLGYLLLIVFITLGILNYDKYGISWDEPAQRAIGYVSGGYVLKNDKHLLTYVDRDYGPIFEMSLVAIEKILYLKDTRDIYLMRHLVGHLFFLTCAFFCFLLVDFLYKNKLLASTAFLLIVLHPKLYAHSFFNSKDIPFASFFFPFFYVSALAFERRRFAHFIILGILTAILINLRIAGIAVVGFIFLIFLYDSIKNKNEFTRIRKNAFLFTVYLIVTLVALIAFWPFLWSNPIENFMYVFNKVKLFPWNGPVLFNGEVIKAAELPWYYISEWFVISTPIAFVFFGLLGLVLMVINFFRSDRSSHSLAVKQQTILYVFCFIAPVAAIILLHSIVYSDWRHLFFIYPPFVLFIVYAIDYLAQTRLKIFVIGIFIVSFSSLSYFIFSQTPYQHVYFNCLVDRKTPNYLKGQFELDYWGVSYKECLEYIIRHEKDMRFTVAVLNAPGELNSYILKPRERQHLKFVNDLREAKYFITNDRSYTQRAELTEFKEYHSIKVLNNTINTIFVRTKKPSY